MIYEQDAAVNPSAIGHVIGGAQSANGKTPDIQQRIDRIQNMTDAANGSLYSIRETAGRIYGFEPQPDEKSAGEISDVSLLVDMDSKLDVLNSTLRQLDHEVRRLEGL